MSRFCQPPLDTAADIKMFMRTGKGSRPGHPTLNNECGRMCGITAKESVRPQILYHSHEYCAIGQTQTPEEIAPKHCIKDSCYPSSHSLTFTPRHRKKLELERDALLSDPTLSGEYKGGLASVMAFRYTDTPIGGCNDSYLYEIICASIPI